MAVPPPIDSRRPHFLLPSSQAHLHRRFLQRRQSHRHARLRRRNHRHARGTIRGCSEARRRRFLRCAPLRGGVGRGRARQREDRQRWRLRRRLGGRGEHRIGRGVQRRDGFRGRRRRRSAIAEGVERRAATALRSLQDCHRRSLQHAPAFAPQNDRTCQMVYSSLFSTLCSYTCFLHTRDTVEEKKE